MKSVSTPAQCLERPVQPEKSTTGLAVCLRKLTAELLKGSHGPSGRPLPQGSVVPGVLRAVQEPPSGAGVYLMKWIIGGDHD